MPSIQCIISSQQELLLLKDTVHLKNGAPEAALHPGRLHPPPHAGRPSGWALAAHSLLRVPPDPDLLGLLALICSHLTPCAPTWMCQEILQT